MAHDAIVKRFTADFITYIQRGRARFFAAVQKIRDPNQTYTADDIANDVASWWLDLADLAFTAVDGSPLVPVAFLSGPPSGFLVEVKETVFLRDPIPASVPPTAVVVTDLQSLAGDPPITGVTATVEPDRTQVTITAAGMTPAAGLYQGLLLVDEDLAATVIALVT